jgi:hypothetical protein
VAALQLCRLTVSNATIYAITGPAKNTQNGMGERKLNLPRNTLPRKNETGRAIKNAIVSHLV